MKRESSTAKRSDESIWYVGHNETWKGPFTTVEVVRKVEEGVLSWADFTWKPQGDAQWTRICELAAFRQYLPKRPSVELINEIRQTAKRDPRYRKAARNSIWFLRFEGSEFGPLTQAEVEVILKSGRLKGELKARREGVGEWKVISEIPELVDLLGGPPQGVPAVPTRPAAVHGPSGKPERRTSRRVPLVATVRFAFRDQGRNFEGPFLGICRDINQTGMLILSNHCPTHTAQIRVEVIPLGSSGLDSFIAEAQLIRALADRSGFSIRFVKMGQGVIQAIEKYMVKNV